MEVELIGTVLEPRQVGNGVHSRGKQRDSAAPAWSGVLKSELVSTHTGNQLQNNGIQAGKKGIHMGSEGVSGAGCWVGGIICLG